MNIESAQYITDGNGANTSIKVIHDGGEVSFVDVDGQTWVSMALAEWQKEAGNTIAPASVTGQS